jgi:heme-degrading monooxygenase HmoA
MAHQPYTHTTWVVKPGLEETFVERWSEWADWSRTQGFRAQAVLLRDLENPRTFVSFGPWESLDSVRQWRGSPGYHERARRLHEAVESFEPRTFEVVERR